MKSIPLPLETYVSMATELGPRKKTKFGGAASLFEALGLRDLAIEEYSEHLKLNPHPRIYFLRGQNRARQYRWSEAALDFRAAVAPDVSNADYHYRLGLSLERQEAFTEAGEAYRAFITSASISDYRRYRAVRCYSQAGHFKDAVDLISGTSEDSKGERHSSVTDDAPLGQWKAVGTNI